MSTSARKTRSTDSDLQQAGQVGEVVNIFRDMIPEDARARMEAERQRRAGLTPEQLAEEEAERQRQARIAKSNGIRSAYFKDSGLEGRMLDTTFTNYKVRHPLQKDGRDACRSFLKHFAKTSRGPALWGKSGVGKSHLLRATCVGGLQAPEIVRVKYLDCITLGPNIKARPGLIEWALDCELLALDDIGKALVGQRAVWAYEALIQILQTVDSRGWPKLACTAQAPLRSIKDELGEILTPGYEEADELDDYVIGRLDRHFHWFQVDGPNGRDPEYWEHDAEGIWWT